MKPIKKQVLFKPFLDDEKSEGGIIVPDSVRGYGDKGEIVEVGRQVTKVRKGQIAHRVHLWGEEYIINGEKHFIMDEHSILAVYE